MELRQNQDSRCLDVMGFSIVVRICSRLQGVCCSINLARKDRLDFFQSKTFLSCLLSSFLVELPALHVDIIFLITLFYNALNQLKVWNLSVSEIFSYCAMQGDYSFCLGTIFSFFHER